MAKNESNQLNLTVVALVALVAIVGLVALVLNAGAIASIPQGGVQLAEASDKNVAGEGWAFGSPWGGGDSGAACQAIKCGKCRKQCDEEAVRTGGVVDCKCQETACKGCPSAGGSFSAY